MKIGRILLPYGAERLSGSRWKVFNREYERICHISLDRRQEAKMRKHAVEDQGDTVYFYSVMFKPSAYGKFLLDFYSWSD